MSFGLRILPAAERDTDEIASYILRESEDQAGRFFDAFEATCRHIKARPHAWRPVMFLNSPRAEGLRYRPVLGFPNHLVLYRVVAESVDVVRVLHAARDLPSILAQELGADAQE